MPTLLRGTPSFISLFNLQRRQKHRETEVRSPRSRKCSIWPNYIGWARKRRKSNKSEKIATPYMLMVRQKLIFSFFPCTSVSLSYLTKRTSVSLQFPILYDFSKNGLQGPMLSLWAYGKSLQKSSYHFPVLLEQKVKYFWNLWRKWKKWRSRQLTLS